MGSVDLYNNAYARAAEQVYQEIRRETYGRDLGQTGWATVEDFDRFFQMLELSPSSHVLEVGCGAGGCATYLAEALGVHVTGVDVNKRATRTAEETARASAAASRLRFVGINTGEKLPFGDGTFDAVFSNDAMCHIPDRIGTLREWHRVLRPGGRMLFTDAMIVTGILTNEEIATRSSIGTYFFLPLGVNEKLVREAGFELVTAVDVTQAAEEISGRWRGARAHWREQLTSFEGAEGYGGLQKFLACVHAVSRERRLSRYLYVGRRSETAAPLKPIG